MGVVLLQQCGPESRAQCSGTARFLTGLGTIRHYQDFKMNPEKLKQMQANVRIGGKGTARRKKKVVHRTATTDDKKLQSSLKKLSVNNIPGIEEVNMIKDDG